MKTATISLFANDSASGIELVELLKKAFVNISNSDYLFTVNVIKNGDQADMMVAGLMDDIVIFDASLEDTIGINYKAAQMWPTCMEHFFVVSRTPLPLNFQPYHEGGTPGLSTNNSDIDNNQIVNWIISKIEELKDRLPRHSSEKLFFDKEKIGSHQKNIFEISEKIISDSSKRREEYNKKTGRAFVSYLSRYSIHHNHPEKFNGIHIEDVVEYIKNSTFDRDLINKDFAVKYYPPGSISGEFMTEHRRWQILSIIDWRIRASDEFWIFETPDYYDSWWTLAELAALAYAKYNLSEDRSREEKEIKKQKIFLCKPNENGKIESIACDDSFITNINCETARNFGRYISNSDPLTMGIESVPAMKLIAKLPMPIQWLNLKFTIFLTKIITRNSPMYQDMTKETHGNLMEFSRFREMIKSPVFTDGFWNDRIIDCRDCMKKIETIIILILKNGC